MRESIGGTIGLAQLGELCRDEHRPRTRQELERAILDLADRQFSDHTISAIVLVSIEVVRQVIGSRT